MKSRILPVAALALIGATDVDEKDVRITDPNETIVLPFDNPSYLRTSAQAKLIKRAQSEASPSDEQCRDRIAKAHNEGGKSDLPEREPASPDKPYHIHAVDKLIGGCAVMVMKGDAKVMRPLPALNEAPQELHPLPILVNRTMVLRLSVS